MEETVGSLVQGLENVVKPLGFSIQGVEWNGGMNPLFFSETGKEAADNEKLTITVVHHGHLG